jgi:cytidylate kinase
VEAGESFLAHTEAVMRAAAQQTGGVLLGRAGAVVLRGHPGALHVRLTGPQDARVRQAAQVLSLDDKEARHRLGTTDRARETYVRHFYRTDPTDCALYHLVIDSTALSLDTCIDLIIAASNDRKARDG